jgi:hypothetical protein
MVMRTPAPSIPFAGSHLGEIRHVCAFFNSADEEYRQRRARTMATRV